MFSNPGIHHHPDKGHFNGSCNREVCQQPGATWYNDSTEKYYCEDCARLINFSNRDWKEHGFKRPLCNLATADKLKG